MNLLEQGIWERIREGDLKTFELLFNAYYKGLYMYAYDFLKNKEDAEEIVLDIFSDIWSDRMSIIIHTSLKSYLYKSVHNRCINFIKRTEVSRQKAIHYTAEVMIIVDQEINVKEEFALDHLIAQELEKEVESAIATLPGQCREVFYLSRFEQMKINEIAIKLNISVSTVKTHLIRAIDKLRDVLGKHLH
jgi:RNA polymerase sigma-70 factor (ECF subfamily)